MTRRIIEIPLDEVFSNPEQPRNSFDEEALNELAQSIDSQGLISPITVQPKEDGGYLIVAGERRFRAHQLLQRPTIEAIVMEGNIDELALIENVQRQDLHPVDEAAAYRRMIQQHGYTHEELAKVVGKSRVTITKHLKICDLPDSIQKEALSNPQVSKSVLLEVAAAPKEQQQNLWRRAKTGATVQQARQEREPTRRAVTPAQALRSGRAFLKRLSALSNAEIVDSPAFLELLRLNTDLAKRFREIQEGTD